MSKVIKWLMRLLAKSDVVLFVQDIVEVLYSPVKAFKRIAENPDFKAAILILVLTASVLMVSQYIASSKLFIETRAPEMDDWTESLTEFGWVSNGALSLDGVDYKTGVAGVNHSIASSAVNDTGVWVKSAVEAVNCSEGGYFELFFWIKGVSVDGVAPSSGSVKLFSGADSYFESDITGFLGASGVWSNATIQVGAGQGWTSVNSTAADWESIVGVEFGLGWSSASNVTLKVDDVFFRMYSSPLESGTFEAAVPAFLLEIVLNFAMNWILWAGILILVAKLFNEELGRWNVVFVIVGYSFIATVVYNLVNLVPLSALPPLNVPLDPVVLNALLEVTWRPLAAYQLWLYIPIVGEAWIAALGAVVVHTLREEITWGRAVSIAGIAFALRFLLRVFLGF